MPRPTDTDQIGGFSSVDRMFEDKTTKEVVDGIVASDPIKHGVPLEERKRRALEAAKAQAKADEEFFSEDGNG